jgi:hypothetical protein
MKNIMIRLAVIPALVFFRTDIFKPAKFLMPETSLKNFSDTCISGTTHATCVNVDPNAVFKCVSIISSYR